MKRKDKKEQGKKERGRCFFVLCSLFIALLFTACPDGNGGSGGGNANPFIGTWIGTDIDGDNLMVTFTATGVSFSWPDWSDINTEGTYSRNGSTAALSGLYDYDNGEDVSGTATISANAMTITTTPGWYSPYTLARYVPNTANPFIGTWRGTDIDGDTLTVTFTADTVSFSWPDWPEIATQGTYTFSGSTATLSGLYDIDNDTAVTACTATVDANTMTITSDPAWYTPYTLERDLFE
jgi:hypothetical protein